MATEKVIRAWKKKQPKPKKCERDGPYWLSKCDRQKLVVVHDESPLWGIQKCENCGGSWTWGD